MFSSWITVLFCIHYIDPLLTVTCVYYEKGDRFMKENKTTCEGDFCYNYGKPKNVFGGREIDQGCASGFDFPMGCVGDPMQGTLCLCNTSNCNSKVLKGTEGIVPPNSSCYGYEQIYADDIFTEAQKRSQTQQGAVCSLIAKEFYFGEWGPLHTKTSSASNTNTTHLFLLPVGSQRRCIDLHISNFFILFYHLGGIYHSPASNYNEYHYKCKGDYCNAIQTSWVTRGKVNCTRTVYGTWPYPSCYGTICIFGLENFPEDFSDGQLRDCWNVNETNAEGEFTEANWDYVAKKLFIYIYENINESWFENLEYKISNRPRETTGYRPGIYKFKNMTWYLCDEDHCNEDEQSARKSIENYRLAIKNEVALNVPNKGGVLDNPMSGEKTNQTLLESPNPLEKGSAKRSLEILIELMLIVYWSF